MIYNEYCINFLGMGTLGIPYAIKVGGLASIVHIVAIAIITCYTSGLIIEAQYDQDSNDCEDTRPMKTRTGYAAIGTYQNAKFCA